MCEQRRPRQLVDYAATGRAAGFDYAVISDHYFPWLEEQGHAPYAWSVLGAVAHATERLPLMTFVTCPIIRYHPAVVAQKAGTMGALSEGRFTLGLGAGENLNEHVIGGAGRRSAPARDVREALQIIRRCSTAIRHLHGQLLRRRLGQLCDLPDRPVPIGHRRLRRTVGATSPPSTATPLSPPSRTPRIMELFDDAGGDRASPVYGQLAICYGPDARGGARPCTPAVALVRQRAGRSMAELPGPVTFAAAAQFVRPGGRRRGHPVRPRRGRGRRGGQEVRRRRLHPRRARADRRRPAAALLRLGREELLPALRRL